MMVMILLVCNIHFDSFKIFTAIIITGGFGTSYDNEVYRPSDGSSCQLPKFPWNPVDLSRVSHTQDGLMACGGQSDGLSCSTLTSDGEWTQTHHLMRDRAWHSSWATDEGVMLMGGAGTTTNVSPLTSQSEIAKPDGSVEMTFPWHHEIL